LTAIPALSTLENLEWERECPKWTEPKVVKLQECRAKEEKDRVWILDSIERTNGIDNANKIVANAINSGIEQFVKWRNSLDEETKKRFVAQRSWGLDDFQMGLGIATGAIGIGRSATNFGLDVALASTRLGFGIARLVLRSIGKIPGLGLIMGGVDSIVGAAQQITEGALALARGIAVGSLDATTGGLGLASNAAEMVKSKSAKREIPQS